MLLLIDNYDSFVFNLGRYLNELGCETEVVRNDALSVAEIRDRQPSAIVISPGPCTPREAGVSVDVIRELGSTIPILGVCLGHQAIATAFGGDVPRAPVPVHGKTSQIVHEETRLFAGIPNPFRASRYHSLMIDDRRLPEGLRITARSAEGIPMAVEHRGSPIFGVQFHPESILTEHGHRLLANFLELAGIPHGTIPLGDLIQPPLRQATEPISFPVLPVG